MTGIHADLKDYRRSVEKCRRLAREAHDEFKREALLRMAAQLERLAEHKAKKKRVRTA